VTARAGLNRYAEVFLASGQGVCVLSAKFHPACCCMEAWRGWALMHA